MRVIGVFVARLTFLVTITHRLDARVFATLPDQHVNVLVFVQLQYGHNFGAARRTHTTGTQTATRSLCNYAVCGTINRLKFRELISTVNN